MDIAKSSQIIKSKDVNMLNAPDNEKAKVNATVNNVRHLAVVMFGNSEVVKKIKGGNDGK